MSIFLVHFFPLRAEEAGAVEADMLSIEENALAELRAPYAGRPRPADLVFDEKLVEKYLNALPEALRASERRRFGIIKGAKDQIISLFKRDSMVIRDSLRLKSGRRVSGTVSLANDKVFIVRKGKSSRGTKGKSYKWSDLSFEGYAEMLDQFAQKRLKTAGGMVSAEESKKYAANDYILLTLLSDWYGEYKLSKEYAKSAIAIRPEIKDQLNELIFK